MKSIMRPARLGPARLGPARLGPARLGPARLGPARLGAVPWLGGPSRRCRPVTRARALLVALATAGRRR
ncbi:hypothetical protein QLR68_23095, partial [Micromonospora sp. DH15]|nr:hypothetical protein [Micromonospora sp. DH15]